MLPKSPSGIERGAAGHGVESKKGGDFIAVTDCGKVVPATEELKVRKRLFLRGCDAVFAALVGHSET